MDYEKSTDELQQMILQLHVENKKISLKMNVKIIKVKFNNYIPNYEIKVNNEVM